MQSDVKSAATENHQSEPPKYEKRIGSTVYRVTVHFSPASTETMEDKLLRLDEVERGNVELCLVKEAYVKQKLKICENIFQAA